HRHRRVQLLPDLADERGLRALVGAALAAGELPEPFEVPTGGPPRDQEAPVALDHRRHHLDDKGRPFLFPLSPLGRGQGEGRPPVRATHAAVHPPSTASTDPVTYPAASEAR